MEFAHTLARAAALLLCAATVHAQAIVVRDGANQTVTLRAPATRIASLVSSSIDIIITLGAADRVVARTRYDTATAVARATSVGGGIDPSVETLIATRPDLFIAWRGQATTPVVARMKSLGVPVYLVETRDTAALYATIRDLGALLGMAPRATAVATQLRQELQQVAASVRGRPRPRAVYVLAAQSPLYIAAATSFMAELISVAGADNPFADVRGEFPAISLEALLARDPDVLLVGTRADGVSQLARMRTLAGWRDLRAVRTGAVIEVDDEQWGRPTPRLGPLVRDLSQRLRRFSPRQTDRAPR
jgi:iron complex transport system substrate-binding protein